MGMRISSQDANCKREQRLSAARPCTAAMESRCGKQVWRFDQNGIGQPAWGAASCEPLRIQRHMADTLRTVDE